MLQLMIRQRTTDSRDNNEDDVADALNMLTEEVEINQTEADDRRTSWPLAVRFRRRNNSRLRSLQIIQEQN